MKPTLPGPLGWLVRSTLLEIPGGKADVCWMAAVRHQMILHLCRFMVASPSTRCCSMQLSYSWQMQISSGFLVCYSNYGEHTVILVRCGWEHTHTHTSWSQTKKQKSEEVWRKLQPVPYEFRHPDTLWCRVIWSSRTCWHQSHHWRWWSPMMINDPLVFDTSQKRWWKGSSTYNIYIYIYLQELPFCRWKRGTVIGWYDYPEDGFTSFLTAMLWAQQMFGPRKGMDIERWILIFWFAY